MSMTGDEARMIDQALFRKVMGSFATGITVVSTQTRGQVRGMTANAFMSGSLDPPLCVVSVALTARMHGHLKEAGHFGVSILARGQERLIAHFAGRPDADLNPPFHHVGRTPVLIGAVATIAAEVADRHDCGDHSLFIGRIVDVRAYGEAPVVVHGGRFAWLTYSGVHTEAPVTDFW